MKKLLSILMTCCLVLLSSSTAVLADGNTNVNDGNNVVFIDSDGPALYYNPNFESEVIYSIPTRYDQNKYLDPLGTCNDGKTIQNNGCALTTLAMVRDYYKGTPYQNPAQLNTSFMVPQGLCWVNWTKIGAIGLSLVSFQDGLSYSYSNNNMYEFAELIKPYLNGGRLVLAELERYVGTTRYTHFIIINGYRKLLPEDGGGYILYVTNSGQSNWGYIDQALNAGWLQISEIVVIDEA